jgi:fatty acid desaturase
MAHISYSHAPRLAVATPPKLSPRYLQVLSALCLVAGSLLLTAAALIYWWPVSPFVLVVGAAVFWMLVALTAKEEPVEA